MSGLHSAFYRFVEWAPERLVPLKWELKDRALALGLKGTVLLAPEGINGFVAGDPEAVRRFVAEIAALPEIAALGALDVKESPADGVPYSRMLVKIKAEIIAMDGGKVRPHRQTGARLPAEELARWLEQGKELVLLDTRNDYEIPFGTFEGAQDLKIRTFKEFPDALRERVAREPGLCDQPVVMFCTGGIRCEKATALALDVGFKHVYQLEGGILRYLEKVGQSHYRGECFVFDHRMVVGEGLAAVPRIQCIRCQFPLASAAGEGEAPTCEGCARGLKWNEKPGRPAVSPGAISAPTAGLSLSGGDRCRSDDE